MKQLSNCCKAEIKLTGSPEHKDAFACAKCGRIIGTPIKKQKPKELEQKKYLWIGGQFNDGDKFEFQAEPKGENKYNPTGIAIGTFNHKSYNGWELNPKFKELNDSDLQDLKIECLNRGIDIDQFNFLVKWFNNILTQQRIEIENQKVKVVWNDVCEQIKQEARTELLEEIKKLKIGERNENDGDDRSWNKFIYYYNQALDKVKNLLNKKDEAK